MNTPIRRALISVYNKASIIDFARQLVQDFHVEILSTGGTAKSLTEAGIPFTSVASYTGSPEMFDGRVKTLHPKIHGGILMRRDNPQDVQDAKTHQIPPIDCVICNLYPFHEIIAKPKITLNEALEMIDIGGPAQIRAAAKSFPYVTVISDPQFYPIVIQEMHQYNGSVSETTRMKLAQYIFASTAAYDALIANYLGAQISSGEISPSSHPSHPLLPPLLVRLYHKLQPCRYGENWEQAAAVYYDPNAKVGIKNLQQLHGKEISFNNWLDIDSCIQVLVDYHFIHPDHQICAILKHTTPNGIAIDYHSQKKACERAFSTDPLSAFGGIWGFNHPLTEEVARFIFLEKKVFVEVLLAPSFEPKALEICKTRENLRLIQIDNILSRRSDLYALPEIRSVLGGVLVQEYDWGPVIKSWDVKTQNSVSDREKEALIFAYMASKWAKSNSAVFVKEYDTGVYTIGVGAGQQSRVHVVKLAAQKATEFGHDLRNSVMGTDSFFPFADGLDAAVDVGCKAIINPGGSVRDNEIIQRADERHVALIFCNKRVFRH